MIRMIFFVIGFVAFGWSAASAWVFDGNTGVQAKGITGSMLVLCDPDDPLRMVAYGTPSPLAADEEGRTLLLFVFPNSDQGFLIFVQGIQAPDGVVYMRRVVPGTEARQPGMLTYLEFLEGLKKRDRVNLHVFSDNELKLADSFSLAGSRRALEVAKC